MACTNRNESFQQAIEKQRGSTLTRIPKILSGLPFYAPGTLSPFWPQDLENENLVKIPKILLRDHNNKLVTEEIFFKKPTVLGFLFTSCAGFCPTLVEKMKLIEDQINDSNYQFVFISVDPEVDTPKVLKSYMEKHHIQSERWKLLTGHKLVIENLIQETFASEVRKLESDNLRKFAHTEHFYLLDEKARLRAVLNGTRIDLPEKIMNVVSQL